MRVAILDGTKCVNIIEADSIEGLKLKQRHTAIEAGEIGIGWELVDGAWTAPQQPTLRKTIEELENEVRSYRDMLLVSSDWTQVADAPVDQAAWAVYRQALRDITLQEGFPEDVSWPTKP